MNDGFELGVYMNCRFIESGSVQGREDSGVKNYLLVTTGGLNGAARVKMPEDVWLDFRAAKLELGDEIRLSVRPFASEGKIFWTASAFERAEAL